MKYSESLYWIIYLIMIFEKQVTRHSQADIAKIQTLLGYDLQFNIMQGIAKAMPWYVNFI